MSANAYSLEYKVYPEFTSEYKHFKLQDSLGVESDPEKKLSKEMQVASNFLSNLNRTVFQLREGCGAVFTSNDGHAVTALHCLDGLKGNLVSPRNFLILLEMKQINLWTLSQIKTNTL